MNIPKGATHKWSEGGFYSKYDGGGSWSIWQHGSWFWIGDDLGGEMVPLFDPHKVVREEIIRQMAEIISTFVADVAAAQALYDAGYRKFEIVEDDV